MTKRSSLGFWVLSLVALWWVFLFTVFFIGAPSAHDWYPKECCSNRDCEEVAVKELADGYHFEHPKQKGVMVVMPYGEYKFSPDGKFHVCYSQSGIMVTPEGKPCFIIPPRNT